LLAYEHGRAVVVTRIAGEIHRHLRLAPHHVEWLVSQVTVHNGYRHPIATKGRIASISRGAKAGFSEFNRSPDRLRPAGNDRRHDQDFTPDCYEAVLLDQVACKPGEAITFVEMVKNRPEDSPHVAKGVGGITAQYRAEC
jgi:hypothetical protein